MTTVKAKFVCESVVKNEGYENSTVNFSAVTTGSEENKSFSKYTPYGRLQMSISDDVPASNFFEAGKEYFLIFEPS